MHATVILLYTAFALSASCVLQSHAPHEHGSHCPPFSGNFTITAYQLYPENADFDFISCLLYIGVVWNASVGIYNPYNKDLEIVEFEGISHDPDYHIGGVAANPRTGLLSAVVDYWPTFATSGKDISGMNYIMLWDPKTHNLLYKYNLTEITQRRFGGYGDLEFDPDNNVYVVGTYPSSILRVNSKGRKKIDVWYLNDTDIANHTISGFTGLAAKDWILIAGDDASGSLYRFNMRAAHGVPHLITVTPPHRIETPDAIQLPPRYKGTVLLIAELFKGVSVFRDRSGRWKEAEFLGTVPWTDPSAVVTAPVQIGDALYMNLIPFGSAPNGGAGNLTEFLYYDITDQVDALLRA